MLPAMPTALTPDDVRRLLANPSVEARAETAVKLARGYAPAALTAEEQRLAVDIMRMMARDAETQVRAALAENLKSNPDIPHDVALRLARDVDAVALPVLTFSSVLSDDDLVAILREGAETKQVAIARRDGISETVSRVIASEAAVGAVAVLMANETAAIPEDAFGAAMDRFAGEEQVTGAMVRRGKLPIGIAERLVSVVSATLREQLAARHELPSGMATDLLLQARERAMVELAWGANQQELAALIDRLHANGRLTPTIVLRAVCTGDEDFFIAAMAKLAGIAVENARKLIEDRGGAGLRRLVEHCHLPRDFYAMARTALVVSRDLEHDGSAADRRRIARLVIERVVSSLDNVPETENLDYLIGKLAQLQEAPLAA
jgi:uncharacterized protein (DUF2336 family)